MSGRNLLLRGWNSPTVTTWASFAAKSLGMVLVLPMILTHFTTAEIAVWYLFISIIGLLILLDLGFSPTFIRAIAQATAGSRQLMIADRGVGHDFESSDKLIEQLVYLMKFIYLVMALVGIVLLSTMGSYFIYNAAKHEMVAQTIYASWAIIIAVGFLQLYGFVFSNYLQGMNEVALVRRWEAITSLLGVFTGYIILFNGGSFLSVVVGTYVWNLISFIRNYWLCYRHDNILFKSFFSLHYSRDLFKACWPMVWKSGLGVLFSQGIVQMSSLVYVGRIETKTLAMYLLSLNLLFQLRNFAMAPFYSKIPMLAKLFAQGNMEEVRQLARKNMRWSHMAFVLGFIGLGLSAPWLLQRINSNSVFASPGLWCLMGVGFFVERYGAMHIQVYSLSNKIIWHLVNGVSGILILIFSIMTLPVMGVYAFPFGVLAGYTCFYAWYTARFSLRFLKVEFWNFELTVSLLPLLILLVFTIIYMQMDYYQLIF